MKTRRYGRLEQQRRLLEECDDAIDASARRDRSTTSIDDQDQDAIDRRERKTLQRKVDIAERKLQKLLADESEAHKVSKRAGSSSSSDDDDGDGDGGGGGKGLWGMWTTAGSVDDDGEHDRMDNPLAAGFVGGAADDGDPDSGDET